MADFIILIRSLPLRQYHRCLLAPKFSGGNVYGYHFLSATVQTFHNGVYLFRLSFLIENLK